jgi:sulfate transport system permease protein
MTAATLAPAPPARARPATRVRRRSGLLALRGFALLYMAALVVVPVGSIAYRAFDHGISAAYKALVQPQGASSAEFTHALTLTLVVLAIAVPLNTIFGVGTAILLARHRFFGSKLLDAFVDLPVAVSPVVVGLSLVLVYGRAGWIGSYLATHGIQIIFSIPGIIIASMFVSLPYVVREVLPALNEIGTEQEQAAATLGAGAWRTFFKVTFPSIRWGVAYGVTLTAARVLGEFGAVSVVSGNIAGRTETLTLFVSDQFNNFNETGAYAGALILASISLMVLGALRLSSKRKERTRWPSKSGVSPSASETPLLSTT